MFCPNCGTQNAETVATCAKCGFQLKNSAAPKFKGTMLMMNQPGPAPGGPSAEPPPANPVPVPAAAIPATASTAPPRASQPSKLKGTMVGVAPPIPPIGGSPSPYGAPPAYGAPPPAAPPAYGAPPAAAYGAPPGGAPAYGAPAPNYGAPPQAYGAPAPNAAILGDGQPVNPLGGTMSIEQVNAYGGGFPPGPAASGAEPPAYGAGYGGAAQPPGAGGPPGVAPGYPPSAQPQAGYGAQPPGAPGAYGAQPPGAPPAYGAPPGGGYGGSPDPSAGPQAYGGGYGGPAPGDYGAGAMQPAGGYGAGYGAGAAPMMYAGAGTRAPTGDNGPKGQVRPELNVLLMCMFIPFYSLIWFISVSNEMSAFLKRDEPSWLKIVGLSIVTCGAYALFWQLTRLGALVQEVQQRAGVANPQNQGILYIVPVYNILIWQGELNKAWSTPG